MGTVQKCGPIGSGPGSALRLAGIHAAWAPHITNKLSNSKPVRQLSRNCLEFKDAVPNRRLRAAVELAGSEEGLGAWRR